ncbi:MAG: hypothetical protein ACHQFZ_04590 [Acidimicrobiales bacterium]
MEDAVDIHLRDLASDSARWKRLGRYGTSSFVDGLLSGLTGVGVVSSDEAATWRSVFLSHFGNALARFHFADDVPMTDRALTPGAFAQFVELVPANQPAKEIPNVCSFQILGFERYDVKGAVIWRMVPLAGHADANDAVNGASFGTGPEPQSMQLSDDRGTSYQMMGGSSGGRIDRVGRCEFRPAPPDDVTILKVQWEELLFEIQMGSNP